MAILVSLSSCDKHIVHKDREFREINESTPVGNLQIRIISTSKKISNREWVTGPPWRVMVIFRNNIPGEINDCTIRIEKLSLMNEGGTALSPEIEWEDMEKPLSLHKSNPEVPVALMRSTPRSFPHKNYRLVFSMMFLGQCEKPGSQYDVNVPLESFSEEHRSSLWDQLMGI